MRYYSILFKPIEFMNSLPQLASKHSIPFLVLACYLIILANVYDVQAALLGTYMVRLLCRISILMGICFFVISPILRKWRQLQTSLVIRASSMIPIILGISLLMAIVEYGLLHGLGAHKVLDIKRLMQFLGFVYAGFLSIWTVIYTLQASRNLPEDEHPSIYSILQLLGWSIAILYWLFSALVTSNIEHDLATMICWSILLGSVKLLISHFILRPFFKYQVKQTDNVLKMIGQGAILCFLCTFLVLYLLILWQVITPIAAQTPLPLAVIIFTVIFGFLLIWSFLYNTWLVWQIKQTAIRQQLALEQAVTQAKLHGLKQQLNPHFLFNTLNSLRALILKDQHAARDMVTYLSNFLRFSLYQVDSNTIELGTEINAVKQFIDIENVRFDHSLIVNWQLDAELEKAQVAPFCLQALVENAAKYGRKIDGEITTYISIKRIDNELQIEVMNTGSIQKSREKGIGLSNTRERLALIFGDSANLTLYEQDSHVIACIRHPYIELES